MARDCSLGCRCCCSRPRLSSAEVRELLEKHGMNDLFGQRTPKTPEQIKVDRRITICFWAFIILYVVSAFAAVELFDLRFAEPQTTCVSR